METITRSWFAIDGTLEPIDFAGPAFFRFPGELAERVIASYAPPQGWVFDPFCGFGTTIHAAQRLGRCGIGFEKERDRARFAARGLAHPNRIINDLAANVAAYDLPAFDLLLTSPPYRSFRAATEEGAAHYFDDLRMLFGAAKRCLQPGAAIVVEMANIRERGTVQTVAWDVAKALATLFAFEGEIVRCNTGPEQAGPGYDHSYLFVYRNA
jgi:tRNA G10  N-methylase Trm11